VFALVSELVRARSGRAGSFTLAFLQLAVFSVALIAGSIALIAGAALAPTKEARNPYIGLAVLVVPMAAVVSWATIAGYRRVRAIRVTSHPPRSANEVYTEMVNASREQTPDPQSPRRQKMMRLFFGIATGGWIIGVLGRTFGTQWGPASAGIAAATGLLLLLGGSLAAGWATVWVFKNEPSIENSSDTEP
jgi:hypothetical protein